MRTLASLVSSSWKLTGLALVVGGALATVGCAGESEAPAEGAQEPEFTGIADVPSQFPTDSGWALSRIKRGCRMTDADLRGTEGSIERTAQGVTYLAKGKVCLAITGPEQCTSFVVARASAPNTSIFAPVTCLPVE